MQAKPGLARTREERAPRAMPRLVRPGVEAAARAGPPGLERGPAPGTMPSRLDGLGTGPPSHAGVRLGVFSTFLEVYARKQIDRAYACIHLRAYIILFYSQFPIELRF